MKKTVFEIYHHFVCFAIICCSVWLGSGLYSLAGVLKPEVTMNGWAYEAHQSKQTFHKPILESCYF